MKIEALSSFRSEAITCTHSGNLGFQIEQKITYIDLDEYASEDIIALGSFLIAYGKKQKVFELDRIFKEFKRDGE